MRLLANENIGRSLIAALRQRGHDVLAVKELMPGATDAEVLARAQAENRILVTQDKDFGELAFRTRLPASSGIILFRASESEREPENQRLLEALDSRDDWQGHFSVISTERIRMRPLPASSSP